MKEYRVKPSSASVTSIVVEGKAHHFFHSEVLGKCRAILIGEAENLPRPGEDEERGHDRWQRDN